MNIKFGDWLKDIKSNIESVILVFNQIIKLFINLNELKINFKYL